MGGPFSASYQPIDAVPHLKIDFQLDQSAGEKKYRSQLKGPDHGLGYPVFGTIIVLIVHATQTSNFSFHFYQHLTLTFENQLSHCILMVAPVAVLSL